ncbi:2-oxo-3-hexenedioate decarboxylase [Natronocella acetinitrilica]|uniref:2-oxo-3-hexenedioate decarboxylase n=1 Tax=Natronocella acetinitrilica TaxID=414046 RepID=A0AAE3G7G1_9GAMM|nr:fumarylacetoacetate hydrolase family protein [Natronocella acetinitrilica]MCP1677079.1 2-oxo-3-hexenedioate decarboxylase [Natronocella acetinitrilica]
MPTSLDLDALASEMKAAQDAAQHVEPFTARLPSFDLATGYDVAHLVHEARLKEGVRPVGRKIGFTNPGMWSRYGVREPIWGYMYDTTVFRLDDTRAACSLAGLVEPKIEPEIVFGFRRAPRAGADISEVLDAVEWVAHGFEIVQSHFPGWSFQAPDTVADGSLHGFLLVGPEQPVSQLGADVVGALESFTLALACNGRQVETGKGSNVLGSPLSAVAHLLSVLASRLDHEPLRAGEIVTTGTVTAAYAVQEGETWRSDVQGISLPGLTVEFSAQLAAGRRVSCE